MIKNANNRSKLDIMNTMYILNLNLIFSDITVHYNKFFTELIYRGIFSYIRNVQMFAPYHTYLYY